LFDSCQPLVYVLFAAAAVRLQEEARDCRCEDTNEADADDHESDGNEATLTRDRRHVAVANRRGRDDRPPERITDRLNVVVLPPLNRENAERSETDDDDRRESNVMEAPMPQALGRFPQA